MEEIIKKALEVLFFGILFVVILKPQKTRTKIVDLVLGFATLAMCIMRLILFFNDINNQMFSFFLAIFWAYCCQGHFRNYFENREELHEKKEKKKHQLELENYKSKQNLALETKGLAQNILSDSRLREQLNPICIDNLEAIVAHNPEDERVFTVDLRDMLKNAYDLCSAYSENSLNATEDHSYFVGMTRFEEVIMSLPVQYKSELDTSVGKIEEIADRWQTPSPQ